MVAGDRLGAHGAELLAEPGPELLQAHDHDANPSASAPAGAYAFPAPERSASSCRTRATSAGAAPMSLPPARHGGLRVAGVRAHPGAGRAAAGPHGEHHRLAKHE